MPAIPSHYQVAAEELNKYLKKSEDYRNQVVEKAFIDWYLKARFGGSEKFTIVDGGKDGGIDAIGDDGQVITILQMKYETRPRLSLLKSEEVADFERVHDAFEDDEAFEVFIEPVREEFTRIYRRAYADIKSGRKSVRFILATTRRNTLRSRRIEIEDAPKVLSLWNLYSEGFTPPVESIQLKLENAWHHKSADGDFTTYVGLADVADFLKLMEKDENERLFAQNVRTDLKTSINKEIQATYEKEPAKFWLGNNGVYIVCKSVSSNDDNYSLIFPSIINGSQTLHSIYRSAKRHSCKILVRVLAMDVTGNPRLLGEVVRRTNTQNPMKSINLVAHDSAQLSIARYLDQFRIFYERREKEWANEKKNILPKFMMVNVKELGQWLSTLDPAIGLGRARSRVGELFQEKYYHVIFEAFDRDFESREYTSLASLVWSGLVVKNLIRRLPQGKKASVKIPQLLFTKFFFDAVSTSPELKNLTGDALRRQLLLKVELPRAAEKLILQVVADFENMQKARQRKDENLDYSNFFKRDKESMLAYQKACTTSRQKQLGKILLNAIK